MERMFDVFLASEVFLDRMNDRVYYWNPVKVNEETLLWLISNGYYLSNDEIDLWGWAARAVRRSDKVYMEYRLDGIAELININGYGHLYSAKEIREMEEGA